MLKFEGKTKEDPPLVKFVKEHYGEEDCNVVVRHSTREDATVPRNNLVVTQAYLDGFRLLRADHVSAYRGAPRAIFVTAESPKEDPAAAAFKW